MPYAKLDSEIIRSSIWADPPPTRVLWITMLAMKDQNGFVATSRSGLMRAANISAEEFDRAVNTLESPDPDSRTPDNDGRRVSRMEGGWLVLNNNKYLLPEDVKRAQNKERVERHRRSKLKRDPNTVVERYMSLIEAYPRAWSRFPKLLHHYFPLLKRYTALQERYTALQERYPHICISISSSCRLNDGGNKKEKAIPKNIEEVAAYCEERGKGVNPKMWFDFYSAKGWMIGKNKMKDWKAAVRTWEEKGRSQGDEPQKWKPQ